MSDELELIKWNSPSGTTFQSVVDSIIEETGALGVYSNDSTNASI